MARGILDENETERKWPSWFRWLGVVYFVVLLLTSTSVPATALDFASSLLMLALWLPMLVGLLYFFEKPAFVQAHKRLTRLIFAVLALHAIFWGLMLVYAFIG